jgi:2-C-methyl-D-erythritol 4-phosphate cytidylyltransferase
MPQVAAILAAAGSGTRLASSTNGQPKQLVNLAGRPIYVWSLLAFAAHPQIATIVVVTLPELICVVEEEVQKLSIKKQVLVVAGGATRQESVYFGLKALDGHSARPEFVLVHDAARPFLNAGLIDACISGVTTYGACTTAVYASDTVKTVESGVIIETLDRQSIVLVQTPQGARFDWLLAAHKIADEKGHGTTDDAALLEYAGRKVAVVAGSPLNIKVTAAADLQMSDILAERLLKK